MTQNIVSRSLATLLVLGASLASIRPLAASTGVPPANTDFPFLTACIGNQFPANNIAYKGIAIKVGHNAAVCFDTDLLRMASGWIGAEDWQKRLPSGKKELVDTQVDWIGKYLNLTGVAFDDAHGTWPSISGEQKFGTAAIPGVTGADGRFTDTRKEPFGPIDHKMGHWQGLYINGDSVILNYTISGTEIHEQPSSVASGNQVGFVRTFQVGKVREPFSIALCDVDQATVKNENGIATLAAGQKVTKVGGVELPKGARIEVIDGKRVALQLDRKASGSLFQVVIWSGSAEAESSFASMLKGKPSIAEFKKGGPSRWPQEVTTQGHLGTGDGAYVVDQLVPPQNNPWNRRVRFGGFDFFKDGKSAAFSTWDGDIWIVTGIDDTLQNLKWKRFASGLYEPLGLAIVDDVIYTSGRDQVTRFHDFNKDGEADYYENFNNDLTSSSGFHEFVFDLQTDKQGNFYTAKAGPVRGGGRGFGGDSFGTVTHDAGTLMKISKDGSKRETVARGFRAPNGIGVGPHGELTTGDNEGTWVPACPINWVKPGGFYGVEETGGKPFAEREKPLVWLHHNTYDNSGGAQVWVTSDRWGPFGGRMLHMSYGQCALYLVLTNEVNNQLQGGVVRIPVNFTSSAMRGHFNPRDGQLYVAGLRGWQTKAANLTGFDRVRYTGKPVYTITRMKVLHDGLQLTFTQPLDPAAASDLQNFSGQRWNYELRHSDDKEDRVAGKITRKSAVDKFNYGAYEVSLNDPLKLGRERVNIESSSLSADGKTVTLKIKDMKPAHQLLVKYDLKAKDGTVLKQELLETIHAVPAQ